MWRASRNPASERFQTDKCNSICKLRKAACCNPDVYIARQAMLKLVKDQEALLYIRDQSKWDALRKEACTLSGGHHLSKGRCSACGHLDLTQCNDEETLQAYACSDVNEQIAKMAMRLIKSRDGLVGVRDQSRHLALRYEACVKTGGHQLDPHGLCVFCGYVDVEHCDDEEKLLEIACGYSDRVVNIDQARVALSRLQLTESRIKVRDCSSYTDLRYEACVMTGGHVMHKELISTFHPYDKDFTASRDVCDQCGYQGPMDEIDDEDERQIIEWSYI